MRVAERSLARQLAAAQPAGNRPDHPELECFGWFERRQYAGEPCGQHRLPRSRRTDHQEIVPACRRDLERALGAFLALDILKVGARRVPGGKTRLRRGQELRPLEMVDIANRLGAAMISTSPAQAASPPQAAGQITPLAETLDTAWGHRGRDGLWRSFLAHPRTRVLRT